MKKFLNLLQKEIRELLTMQLLISLLFTIFLFYFIGQMLKTEMKKAMKVQPIAVLNLDSSELSGNLVGALKMANFEPKAVPERDAAKAIAWTKATDINLLLVIPEGFGAAVDKFEAKEIETYSFLRTFSMVGSRSSVIINAVIKAMNEFISNDFLKRKIPEYDPAQLKSPIKSRDFVIVRDKMAEGAAEKVAGFVASQSVTVPISRTAIVTAKMVASAVVGLISAVIYMIGYRYSFGGFMGDVSREVGSGMGGAIRQLGLAMTTKGYIILGISLFFAILVALALATILGVLAEDYRAAQSLIMPLIFLVMIPYFLSFFSDPKSLSLPMKVLLYAIPFSHPFLTTQNLLLENYQAVALGILYMLAFFVVLIIIAARIFSTDRVLTMKLRFGKKKLVI